MLSAVDLASLRATLVESLPDSAQILRPSRTTDGLGGHSETWTVVATVPCRVGPRDLTPVEQLVAEHIQAREVWTITLPAGTDVRPDDRIVVAGHTYEVASALAPRSYELATRVVAVEVR